ncbi:MAG: hypothetical protein J5959_19290 [Butyrivibrio sp.]|nr:hypothetical protein [Butyrivibrio sp.]
MITQLYHGYFVQIPQEITKDVDFSEIKSFDCTFNGTEICLAPLSDQSFLSPITPVSFTEPLNINPITINCFGKLQLMYNNKPFPIKNKKAKELIGLLMCEQGKLVSKKKAAEMLWPDSTPSQAMNNLYKVCHYLKTSESPISLIPIFIDNQYLSLNVHLINSDLTQFMKLISQKDDDFPLFYANAEALYSGPVLYDECYDWILPYEAFYDIHYNNILEILINHYIKSNNFRMADYYKKKLL